ncbi:response regulator [Fulvivirga maritima]|uniref:response regulator n=1 Tax=Fulvivirga maritima TaxID=2904247 RepID=UPI001F34FE06|nr:response regulator [Fulvivirga maritima]UII26696.1 response regulator [Fulvivirga maritima]
MNSKCADIVMLIDDNEIDVFINQKVIEFDQFSEKVITCFSAREALDYLSNTESNQMPDIIFLDLNMPVIDGFEFLEAYATFPEEVRKHITIIVLTSSDNDFDKERISANSDVLLFQSKPITEEKLNKIRKLLK